MSTNTHVQPFSRCRLSPRLICLSVLLSSYVYTQRVICTAALSSFTATLLIASGSPALCLSVYLSKQVGKRALFLSALCSITGFLQVQQRASSIFPFPPCLSSHSESPPLSNFLRAQIFLGRASERASEERREKVPYIFARAHTAGNTVRASFAQFGARSH